MLQKGDPKGIKWQAATQHLLIQQQHDAIVTGASACMQKQHDHCPGPKTNNAQTEGLQQIPRALSRHKIVYAWLVPSALLY
jgi:hypothetical protein